MEPPDGPDRASEPYYTPAVESNTCSSPPDVPQPPCSTAPEPVGYRNRVVAFYRIVPWDEGRPDFEDGCFPTDEVVSRIRALDAAAQDYRFFDNLFGNERFCHVNADGPMPLWCLYTKDVTSAPETERKGEIRSLILDPDEGIVDASYALFLPHDIVAIVQTSPKAPGSAFFARWVSAMGGVRFYLAPLPNLTVTERLAGLKTTVRRIRFGGRVHSLNAPDLPRTNLATELRALVRPGTDTVTIERVNRQPRNRLVR